MDTQGWLLRAVVLPANLPDKAGASLLLQGAQESFPHLSVIWADQAYNSQELAAWVKRTVGAELVITGRISAGFWLLPGEPQSPTIAQSESLRWIVERSFGWIGRNRRLSKDYEYLPETEEAFCYLAMTHLILKRLTK